MPLIVNFLVPRRPVSHQAKNRENLKAWMDFVYARALAAWPSTPLTGMPLRFTMVYLTESSDPEERGDINNFVKPVQDALNGLIYADDNMIMDVSAHMRVLSEPISPVNLPIDLAEAVIQGAECVYVAISNSSELAEEMK